MNAAGGGLAVQGGVGSVVIVVVEPGLVGGFALGLAGVGVSVGPLEGQSTVEALDLAACLGPVGAGVAVLDAGCGQDLVEGPCAVAGPVVGHDGLDGDAQVLEERVGALNEPGGGVLALIIEDLGVDHTRVVVYRVVDVPIASHRAALTAGAGLGAVRGQGGR